MLDEFMLEEFMLEEFMLDKFPLDEFMLGSNWWLSGAVMTEVDSHHGQQWHFA